MRSFIIAILILSLCLGASIMNTVLTRRVITDALDELDTILPENAERFSRHWQTKSALFSFTVKRSFLRDISDALQRLDAAADHNDEYEFEAAKAALIYKMKELYRSQSFDIKSVL